MGKIDVSHTSFPFGEGYVTSGFILDEFDLDLPSSCLLVCFRLVVIIIIITGAVDSVVVVYERVFLHRLRACGRRSLGINRAWLTVHIESTLAFTHSGRSI